MERTAIAREMMRLGAESLAAHVLGDPLLTPRHAFAVSRRGGLWCFSSGRFALELFNHVSGYGTFGPSSQRAIDAVVRHYDALGRPASVEVLAGGVRAADVRRLERSGFRHTERLFQCHVRTSGRPPRVVAVPGFTVTRAGATDADRYGKLATRGFGSRDRVSLVFERGWARQIRRDRRVGAFVGALAGRPAATGVILVRPAIAGLYSGSVLPAFRGRGLQNAMIRARLAHGWARGVRTFYSWTDPETPSARNLREEGFRTMFEVHLYTRKP